MESGHKYWACSNPRHRHLLQSTATACIRSDERSVFRHRRWGATELEALLESRRAGASEVALAASHELAVPSVHALLRHADGLRLRFTRRRGRWDGTGDPWAWLSTPAYCELRAAGFDSMDKVREALDAGAFRNRGYNGLAGRQISVEIWRWFRWLGESGPAVRTAS